MAAYRERRDGVDGAQRALDPLDAGAAGHAADLQRQLRRAVAAARGRVLVGQQPRFHARLQPPLDAVRSVDGQNRRRVRAARLRPASDGGRRAPRDLPMRKGAVPDAQADEDACEERHVVRHRHEHEAVAEPDL
eukprot:COSAG05_NODE_8288_length_718_cov_0.767367_2_plen_133_part_01